MHNTCSLFVFNPFSFLINYILVIKIIEMNIDMIENCFLQIILQFNVFIILINWVSFLYYNFFHSIGYNSMSYL